MSSAQCSESREERYRRWAETAASVRSRLSAIDFSGATLSVEGLAAFLSSADGVEDAWRRLMARKRSVS